MKVALKNDPEDVATNDKVKNELANEENQNVATAATLTTPQIDSLITLLSDEKPKHNLVVLQKLLVQAPKDAKIHLVTALDDSAAKEVVIIEVHTAELQELGAEDHIPLAIRAAILEQVKEKFKDALLKSTVDKIGNSSSIPTSTSDPRRVTSPSPLATFKPLGVLETIRPEPSSSGPASTASSLPFSPTPSSGLGESNGGSGSGSSGSGGSNDTTLHSIRSYYDVISLQVPSTPATSISPSTQTNSASITSSNNPMAASMALILAAAGSISYLKIKRKNRRSK